MSPLPLLQLLYDAAHSPRGTVVELVEGTAEQLRQRLYALRKDDALFADLAFIISPLNPAELWIVKKGAADGQEP